MKKNGLHLINCGPAATFAYKTPGYIWTNQTCIKKCFILAEQMESYFG